jgi:hypothetical protein
VEITEHFGRGWPLTNGHEDNVCQNYRTGAGRGMGESNGIRTGDFDFGDMAIGGTGAGKGSFLDYTNGSVPGEGWGKPKSKP